PLRQKGSRVINIVNPRSLNIDVVKTGFGELPQIILLAQGPSDATRPELHAFLDFGRYVAPDQHIRDSKTTARFEDTKSFFEHTVLVAGKVDDAVRDDDIHRLVGKRDVLDFALKKLDISQAAFALILFGERQHLVSHVEAIRFPCRADTASGKQHINATARAEIEHDFARFQCGKGGWVAATQRGFDGRVRQLLLLRRVVKV